MKSETGPERPRALLSWSSGKDCAWALHHIRQAGEIEVVGLLTTINEHFGRVAMHGTRETLLRAQAKATGLPLWPVPLPWPCPNEVYEQRMAAAVEQALAEGITHMIFGDLHLADVRDYREQKLEGTGITPLFPLWGHDTRTLAREMVDGGLRATVVCLNPKQTPRELAGRTFDHDFLDALPENIDACGENGEFHTFCWQAPCLDAPIQVRTGENVEREGFVFTELVAGD